jgi:hypothetical protein
MDPIVLYPFFSNYEAKVGQQLEYSYKLVGSVGLSSKVYLEKEGVLILKDKVVGNYPSKNQTGTSNTEKIVTIRFEAIVKGKATIIVTEYDKMRVSGAYGLIINVK